MGVLRNIALAVLAISFLTFVALFGQLPALRRTPIGWLQRLLCVYAPDGLKKIDTTITGGRITRQSLSLGKYLFYERNPVILIFFLILLSGAAGLFLRSTISKLPWSLLLPVWVILPAPYIFTYLCASHTAHYITPANHRARIHDYPYDHILFQPGAKCSTCHLIKPPRSKHCSLCGFCVAKCDHHCPWVNNCLGRGNYRYFLALLISIDVLQLYGAYLSWWILRPYFTIDRSNPFFSWAFLQDLGNAVVVAVNRGGISIAGVGMLAASTASLPFGLFVYHCYLIWAGMTTNESQKWSDWKDDIPHGIVYGAKLDDIKARSQERRSNSALRISNDDDEFKVDWPIPSTEILVRTRDGNPPYGQESLWARVKSLDDITNVYDLGAMENLRATLAGL